MGARDKAAEDGRGFGWYHSLNGCEFGETLGDSSRTEKPGML